MNTVYSRHLWAKVGECGTDLLFLPLLDNPLSLPYKLNF